MDSRIQFRINDETKQLAQQMAASQGQTLSDACRELIQSLAEQQHQKQSHEIWLASQINCAFEKLEAGHAHFVDNQTTQSQMEQRKAKIRNRGKL